MLRPFAVTTCLAVALPALAEPPRVVTDIPPVHGLVSMVMDGVGAPDLLLQPGTSAHDFALRPSQAQMLSDAALLVWIGPALTPQLDDALDSLLKGQQLLLADTVGTHRLPMREEAVFEDHDDHAEGEGDDHDHGHDHAYGAIDPHLWLAPENAQVWLTAIAESLAATDPDNAETYRANAESAAAAVQDAERQAQAVLAPVADKPLGVFHDAFQYYETAFALTTLGAVSNSEAAAPGPARLDGLRAHFEQMQPVCVLTEPAADLRLLRVAAGEDVPVAELDPLGAALPLGATLYPALMTDLANRIAACAGSQ